jgi:hypothetical protein
MRGYKELAFSVKRGVAEEEKGRLRGKEGKRRNEERRKRRTLPRYGQSRKTGQR